MNAFVTGGTGFVGSHLTEELLRRRYRVRALVRRDPKWLAGTDAEIIRGDLDDEAALREGLRGVDVVFHVAGLTRAPTAEALHAANVEGTLKVLAAIREEGPSVRRVVVTSSLAAVGPSRVTEGNVVPLAESDPMQPISEYGKSKARMEREVAERFPDLPVTIIRPPAVYGPREADIFTIIQTASRARIFPIVGSGRPPQLSLVHVADLVRGMIDSAETADAASDTFFLSSERGYSWNEIADAVEAALGKRLLRVRVPARATAAIGAIVESAGRLFGQYPALNREKAREAAEAWVCSIEKARQAFGYNQAVPLASGMKEAVDWYREHGWL